MIFSASFDKQTRVITIAVSILFGVIIVAGVISSVATHTILPRIISIFLSLVYLLALVLRPVSYELTDELLIVRRLLFPVNLKRADITRVERVEKQQMEGVTRIFGVGGLFGYYGKFANKTQGNMTWYATRIDNTVLIECNDMRKIIVTPDDPDAFISALSLTLNKNTSHAT